MATDAPPGRANPARGIALIATAVILGLFVLRQGFDTIDDADAGSLAEGQAEEQAGSAEGEGEGGDGADGEQTDETQETTPVTPNSDLTVRVANTTSVNGAAGTWTERIEGNNYQMASAANAAERDRQTTAILFRPGLEREAQELATAFPTPETVEVAEMPADSPPVDRNDAPLFEEGVHLVVLLGADFADTGGS